MPQDDVAFLRQLLTTDHGVAGRRRFGTAYFLCGLLWGPFTLLQWVQYSKLIDLPASWMGVLWIAVAIGFAGVAVWDQLKARKTPSTVATRALNASFAGIGFSYLAMLIVLLAATRRSNNVIYLLLYSVVVFAGQGAGWYVAWALQRRAWLLAVAVGWFVATLILGFSLRLPDFLLVAGVSMVLLMALPGWYMMSSEPKPT